MNSIRLFLLIIVSLFATTAAHAEINVVIDKTSQQMLVFQNGTAVEIWDVSTGKMGHETPSGVFGVQFLDADHYSSLYNNAPMPWSVFFNGDIAIHGTTEISKLGQIDSHGCVRLHPENAKVLFRMIQKDSDVTIAVRD